jgi:hypothetical protein
MYIVYVSRYSDIILYLSKKKVGILFSDFKHLFTGSNETRISEDAGEEWISHEYFCHTSRLSPTSLHQQNCGIFNFFDFCTHLRIIIVGVICYILLPVLNNISLDHL